MNPNQQVALVTGASRGIGAAIAKRAAACGSDGRDHLVRLGGVAGVIDDHRVALLGQALGDGRTDAARGAGDEEAAFGSAEIERVRQRAPQNSAGRKRIADAGNAHADAT